MNNDSNIYGKINKNSMKAPWRLKLGFYYLNNLITLTFFGGFPPPGKINNDNNNNNKECSKICQSQLPFPEGYLGLSGPLGFWFRVYNVWIP